MANTLVSNIVLPTEFARYVADASTLKSNLFSSGVIAQAPNLAITKGAILNMPFIKQLARGSTPLSDSTPLVKKAVATDAMSAIVHSRGDAWGVNDLAAAYAGEDLVGFIAEQFGQYWADEYQSQVIATLKGVMAGAAMASHVYDGTAVGAGTWTVDGFINARYKLGDARSKLGAILVPASVVALMEKDDNNLSRSKNSDGNEITTYRGLTVIEADELVPVGTGNAAVQSAYLLGAGAFGFANGLDLATVGQQRDELAGDTTLVTRQSYVLHPQGFKTNLTITANGESPTNAQLANAAAFTRVVDSKNVAIVEYKFKP
jgi:hypothetical protein